MRNELRMIFFIVALMLFAGNANVSVCEASGIYLNGKILDDEAAAKLITVITATSPIKSNPDTKLLETAQASLSINPVLAKCKKIIVFDQVWPQNWGSEGHTNYEQFKKNVTELTQTNAVFANTKLVFCQQWKHLCGAVQEAIDRVDTPYVYMHQHDLILKKDFDLTGVLATMLANATVKYVNLWGGINRESTWYTLYVDEKVDGIHFVPLCRSCGWTDQAHISSVDYYNNFVLPMCSFCFMEGSLNPALSQAVYSQGIDAGHKPFGVYLYGDLNDGNYIFHLDGRIYE